MKKQIQRLAIAAVISSSVFTGTYLWYKHSASDNSDRGAEKPVAYVAKLQDDIQRRPASRLLWQLIYTGEPLYNGEAVRTSERGEVRIQFVDSDSFLDLEPDSLIVIKKDNGDIALDLMEGSLFVNAKNTSDKQPAIVLNSDSGKVDLSKASASLSKSRSGTVDVQVLEGKASIKGSNGESRDVENRTNVRILTPLPTRPILKNVDDLSPIPFQWQGFPRETQVTVWTGPSRRLLKEAQVVPINQSHTAISLPFGRHFWKLTAATPDGKVIAESPTYRVEIVARYAPTVVFPLASAIIPITEDSYDMTFKWQKSDDTKMSTLEVWSDPDLKHKITEKNFATEDSYTVLALPPGVFYWRMSSYFDGSNKPIVGRLQSFTLSSPEKARSLAAIPEKVNIQFGENTEQENYFYIQAPQLDFSWKANNADNVSLWRVHVEEESTRLKAARLDLKGTQFKAPLTKPGRYIASIEALDSNGLVIATSPSKIFNVAPLPLLPSVQFYPAEGPLRASMDGRTSLEWQEIDGAKDYWLTIRKNGKEVRRSKYQNNKTALRNLLPGEYEIEIVAEDNHGRMGQASPARKLIVPDKSNVKAPTLKRIQVN